MNGRRPHILYIHLDMAIAGVCSSSPEYIPRLDLDSPRWLVRDRHSSRLVAIKGLPDESLSGEGV